MKNLLVTTNRKGIRIFRENAGWRENLTAKLCCCTYMARELVCSQLPLTHSGIIAAEKQREIYCYYVYRSYSLDDELVHKKIYIFKKTCALQNALVDRKGIRKQSFDS